MPHAANTASDDPSTTNSRSSVRKVNWKGGRGDGSVGWGSGSLMSCLLIAYSREPLCGCGLLAALKSPPTRLDGSDSCHLRRRKPIQDYVHILQYILLTAVSTRTRLHVPSAVQR